jgi:hypothetical protein
MSKTIFVIGCSYSHHDSNLEPEQSWPAILAETTGYKIINGSLPGSSNDSYFRRLLEMESLFGKPDQVIIQITNPNRVMSLRGLGSMYEIERINKNYYVDVDDYPKPSVFYMTPGGITDSTRLDNICRDYDLPKRQIENWYSIESDDQHVKMKMIKEIKLIELYYKNVVTFQWNRDDTSILLEPINHLGSMQHTILKHSFNDYVVSEYDNHFTLLGHKKVAEIMENHV